MRTGEHPSREWVPLQYLSPLEPLTGMGEHPSREWVSSVWADWNHWWEWVNTPPDRESLSSWSKLLTKMGECLSRLWVAFQCASVSVNMIHLADHVSRKWVLLHLQALNHLWIVMMLILCLECNLISLTDSLINFIVLLWSPSRSLIWLFFLICTLKRMILACQCL